MSRKHCMFQYSTGGKCISMCWDSTGIGKKRGFEITRIRVVCHGACHNDTIITVDQKSVRTAISTIFENKDIKLPQSGKEKTNAS